MSGPAVVPDPVTGPGERLRIEGLRAGFGDLEVLAGLDLTARDGEFVSILGPSGSGKSTLFGVLTRAVTPTAGRVLVQGEPLSPRPGDLAYLPQRDALLPWRTILDNLTLGLEVQGVRRREARARVSELLEPFGLAGFERAYPAQLSGGMRQRAALLRTVVQRKGLMLLDEPFGALDALTRTRMQTWLEGIRSQFSSTVLLITHDIREAVFLSDRIYVFSQRPARIVAEVVVDLPRPRTLDVITDPRFAAVEARLLRLLMGDERTLDEHFEQV